MPIDYKNYSDNWRWLSKQVIKDASNKCELCYAPNGKKIIRGTKESLYPWTLYSEGPVLTDEKIVKIVLTVHHINSDKKDNRKQNLIVLCQKCYLRLDSLKHMGNRLRNKNKNNECLEL